MPIPDKRVTIRQDPTFGDHYQFPVPPGCNIVIVCSNDGTGLRPLRLLLPHQVSVRDWCLTPGLTIVPAKSEDYITINR